MLRHTGIAPESNRRYYIPAHIREREQIEQDRRDSLARRTRDRLEPIQRASKDVREQWTEEMQNQVRQLLQKTKTEQRVVSRALGFSHSSFCAWLKGESRPLVGTHARVLAVLRGAS